MASWSTSFILEKVEAQRLVARLLQMCRKEVFGCVLKVEFSGFDGGVDGVGERGSSRRPQDCGLRRSRRAEQGGGLGLVERENQELVITLREPSFLH